MSKQVPISNPKRPRQRRVFSTVLKQKIVRDFERNLFTVIQLSKAHEVTSTSIYRWIKQYSSGGGVTTQVVQMKSEQHKTALLQEEINELQRLIGQQRVLISLHDKIFEHASEEVGYDLKKKYAPLFSKISAKTLNAPTP